MPNPAVVDISIVAEPARTLVLVDGGVAALVACALSPGRRTDALLMPLGDSSRPAGLLPRAARAAAHRQRELLELSELIEYSPDEAAIQPANAEARAGLALSCDLMRAASIALARSCDRVVWPVVAGESTDAIADACERALLVTRLISIDAPAFRIEIPFVDLMPLQVAELAFDLDVPVEAAWWCEANGNAPCGKCSECVRWATALRQWRLAPEAVAGIA